MEQPPLAPPVSGMIVATQSAVPTSTVTVSDEGSSSPFAVVTVTVKVVADSLA